MGEKNLKFFKTEIPDNKWKCLTENLAFLNEYFIGIDGYQKSIDNLKKEGFFSKLKNKCPDDEEIERTKQIMKLFDNKNGEELTQLFLKSDVLLLACVF